MLIVDLSVDTTALQPDMSDSGLGLTSLLEQVRRKVIRQGCQFSVMVVGEAGLGKSTLINSLFSTDILERGEGQVRRHVVDDDDDDAFCGYKMIRMKGILTRSSLSFHFSFS